MRALPCDAAVLLRLTGNELVPIAAHGLSPDVLGRSFARAVLAKAARIAAHVPRWRDPVTGQ